jgi:hypothetical protein
MSFAFAPKSPQPVTDNSGSLTVDGTVNVGNLPATYPVTDNGGSLTVDGTVAVSAVAGDVEVIDHDHKTVHEGIAFLVSNVVTLSINNEYRWLITAPAAPTYIHLFLGMMTTSETLVKFFETPTTPTAGTAVASINRNRTSATAGAATVGANSTNAADGTLIATFQMGSGRAIGDHQSDYEIILEASTQYVVYVKAIVAGTVSLILRYYHGASS